MSTRISASSALAAVVAFGVVSLSTTGCAVDTDTTGLSESALSSTRSRIIPTDDASREACREVAQRIYCSEAEARAALGACSPAGAIGKAVVESRAGTCAASGLAYPTIASCETPLDTDCSYYAACLERAIPCGKDGYALGFGEKYCTAFRAAKLSTAGRRWVGRVMGCLQRALVADVVAQGSFATTNAPATKCQEVFGRAFDSHPACYTAKEGSICFLPPSDLAAVLKTIGLRELLTPRTGGQMVTTVGLCIGQLTERLFGFGASSASGSSGVGTRGISLEGEVESLTRDELESSLAEWKRLEAEGAAETR